MNEGLEALVRQHVPWERMSAAARQTFSNSKEQWEQEVRNFSLRNQLNWRSGLVRSLYQDEKKYYEELVQLSRESLLLFPYHLSDVLVRGLKISPFAYYREMMFDLMMKEKSYDSLPNFTATDCVRLLGIGRNEYIDKMNRSKSVARTGLLNIIMMRRKTVISELLPTQPVDFTIEPWWIVRFAYVTEETLKACSPAEEALVRRLFALKHCEAGLLPLDVLRAIYRKGVVYFDVPVSPTDSVAVPPLENFVMNRVQGDYFETLLYKVFVSIDENTTIQELSSVLLVDVSMVQDAVSVYCRLGFAVKKGVPDADDNPRWDDSWKSDVRGAALLEDGLLPSHSISRGYRRPTAPSPSVSATLSPPSPAPRIAFLYDATLTAFLMMGNLSPGLKMHAVTMFEVGKLASESVDALMEELKRVEEAATWTEGDADRYFVHAIALKEAIACLRREKDGVVPMIDLVRYESLTSLDSATQQRILARNYDLLVSMAPISPDCRTIPFASPPHLGPPIPEVNALWFRLFLYATMQSGPVTALYAMGARVASLPLVFLGGASGAIGGKSGGKASPEWIMLTMWEQAELPKIVHVGAVLPLLNEMLTEGPVMVQAVTSQEATWIDKVFPAAEGELGAVGRFEEPLGLRDMCGYVRFVRGDVSDDVGDDVIGDMVPFSVHYGVPLFDLSLTRRVAGKIESHDLLSTDKLGKASARARRLALSVLEFVRAQRGGRLEADLESPLNAALFPTYSLLFANGGLSRLN